MPTSLPAPGDAFGTWTLKRPLGRGNHGEVWSASAPGVDEAAIKLVSDLRPRSYARFRSTLTAIIAQGHAHRDGRPWYVMPIAVPFTEHPAHQGRSRRVASISGIASVLAGFHERGISHGNIKPRNLLAIGGVTHLADWGLADLPAADPDGRPTDVDALTRTRWMLLTNSAVAFEGPYSSTGPHALEPHFPKLHIVRLDSFLADCRGEHPAWRPAMPEVMARIDEWL